VAKGPPSEGLGGLGGGGDSSGPGAPTDAYDPTLAAAHDAERVAREQEWIDGRPVDSESGWGSQLASCHGIPAFKNVIDDDATRQRIATTYGGTPGVDKWGLCVSVPTGNAYQCVEFVNRYYRDALGVAGIGGGNGGSYLQGARGGLEVHRFPTPTRPQAGDLMVQEGSPGHVAIAESVSGDDGAVTVHAVQQNWAAGSTDIAVTTTTGAGMLAPGGDMRPMRMYTAGHGWSGFRRKAGTTPTGDRGGGSASVWADRKADHGTGNYIVKVGETAYLDNVKTIYGITLQDLQRLNPCMPNVVSATTAPIEIRVSGAFPYPEPPRWTATVVRGLSPAIRPQASRSGYARAATSVAGGSTVQIYEVVDGQDVDGNKRWYRIAIFSNEPAYVHSSVCEGGPA